MPQPVSRIDPAEWNIKHVRRFSRFPAVFPRRHLSDKTPDLSAIWLTPWPLTCCLGFADVLLMLLAGIWSSTTPGASGHIDLGSLDNLTMESNRFTATSSFR